MSSNPKIRTIKCDRGNTMEKDENSTMNIMEQILSLKQEHMFLSHESSMREEYFRTRLDLLRYTGLSPSIMMGDSALVVMGKNVIKKNAIFPNTHLQIKIRVIIIVFETKITKMFGIKHPIIANPMGPFYTTELTIAISEAGGLGVLSHSALISDYMEKKDSVSIMKENLLKLIEHIDKPFGFNVKTSRREIEAKRLVTEIPKFIMSNPKLQDQVLYAITNAGSSKILPELKEHQKLKQSGSNIKHFQVAPAL